MLATTALFLITLGISAILVKRTLPGVFIGAQILALGCAVFFVAAGVGADQIEQGYIGAVCIIITSVAQATIGNAFSIRLFRLGGRVALRDLNRLKH